MNRLVLKSLAISVVLFALGAIVPPDDLFVRFLGFTSFAMACFMLWAVWPLARRAIRYDIKPPLDLFVIGLFIMNIAWVLQRGLGLLIREFDMQWLVTSDLFGLAFALTIFGQSFKIASIEAVQGKPFTGWHIAGVALMASVVGGILTAAFTLFRAYLGLP